MNSIKTLENLKSEFSPVQNINDIHRERLTKSDKAALFITKRVGTMGFFLLCGILVIIPFIFPETLIVVQYLSSGFLQLLLLPLILVGQNLQGRHAELRAEHDYETNVKAEKEIEAILLHLEKQDQIMIEILKKIEKLEKAE